MLKTAALAVALLAFGTVLPGSLSGLQLEADRCGGMVPPVCKELEIAKCTAWYPCGLFTICCRDWERHTYSIYFPSPE